jgi:hypothetical protein
MGLALQPRAGSGRRSIGSVAADVARAIQPALAFESGMGRSAPGKALPDPTSPGRDAVPDAERRLPSPAAGRPRQAQIVQASSQAASKESPRGRLAARAEHGRPGGSAESIAAEGVGSGGPGGRAGDTWSGLADDSSAQSGLAAAVGEQPHLGEFPVPVLGVVSQYAPRVVPRRSARQVEYEVGVLRHHTYCAHRWR